MSPSIAETILDAHVTALNTSPPVGWPTTKRGPTDATEATQLPQTRINYAEPDYKSAEGGYSEIVIKKPSDRFPAVQRRLRMIFEVATVKDGGIAPETAADAFYVRGHQVIAALVVANARAIEMGRTFEIRAGDHEYCIMKVEYWIDFVTNAMDPSSQT